uniref:Uncharacterized protein n=1 Tax=Equus asinus TaxID=9793 RepID=A0A8C4PTR4_EQUAS
MREEPGPRWAVLSESGPPNVCCLASPQTREGPEARSTLKPHPLPAQVLRAGRVTRERGHSRAPSLPHPLEAGEDLDHHFCLESPFCGRSWEDGSAWGPPASPPKA